MSEADNKSGYDAQLCALSDAQQTRRLRRVALLRRAERVAGQADPRVTRDRCAVVARAVLTAREAASGHLLQLDERHRRDAAWQRQSLEQQRQVACRCSAETLLREREALSGWLLQVERGVLVPEPEPEPEPVSGGVSLELSQAQQRERYMEELVLAVQTEQSTERRAVEQERAKFVGTIAQLHDQLVAARFSSQAAVALVLEDRAALSERVLASELYTPGCSAPEVALKLQLALCARRTADAVEASGKLFEARDRLACRVAAHARAEAEHGCALGEIGRGLLQLRAELTHIGKLGDGPPYRTFCGAGIT